MEMEIKKVTDPAFKAYGKVVSGYDLSQLLQAMENHHFWQSVCIFL